MILNKELFTDFLYFFLTARKITTYILFFSCLIFYSYGKLNNVWDKKHEHEKNRTVSGIVVHKEKAICDGSTCHLIIGSITIDVYGSTETYRTEGSVNPEEYDKFEVGKSFTYTYKLEQYAKFQHDGFLFLSIIWYIASAMIFIGMCFSKLDD